jgi:hypothetical protein
VASFLGAIVSDPTSVRIRELTGERNLLELKGRALPYRPLTLEGGMRAEFTWYPGSPTATVQMLGADERSTVIGGTWKDRFMRAFTDIGAPILSGRTAKAELNGRDIADVRSLVRVVDGFRLRGQLLEFQWDEFVRHGILVRFKESWLRREDVEWELEFQWISRGEPSTPVAFGPPIPSFDVASEISDAVDALSDVVEAPFALASQINNEINEAVDALDAAASSLSSIAEKGIEAVLTPLETVRNLLAGAQSIKETSQGLLDTLDGIPARAMRQSVPIETLVQEIAGGAALVTTATAEQTTSVVTTVTGPTAADQITSLTETAGIASVTHEEALEAEAYKREVEVATRRVRSLAAQRADDLASQTVRVPNVAAIVVADQDDLRDVATAFYGTQEEWKRLLAYNNLPSSKLVAGQIILVPPLNATVGTTVTR